MGSVPSTPDNSENRERDQWWPIESTEFRLNIPTENTNLRENSIEIEACPEENVTTDENLINKITEAVDDSQNDDLRRKRREQSLTEFKEELKFKRMARQNAMAALRAEITGLRQQLKDAQESQLLTNNDPSPSEGESTTTSLRKQLAEMQLSLQLANAENLTLQSELGIMRKQVSSLKDVITCSKEMISVREEQVTQLKQKLHEIEDSLAERELKIMSDDLRQEYSRQLTNIRNLRQLYEEKARVNAAERENLIRQISIKKDELAVEKEKVEELQKRVTILETELNATSANLTATKSQRYEYGLENKELKEEMEAVNKLFSQMLLGFNGENNLDIDRLTMMLEENRTLLNEMATTESNYEGACLPKLLFDIVNQANDEKDGTENLDNIDSPDNADSQIELKRSYVTSTQEIIGNLPKVWRVLIELLNHQKIIQVEFHENGQGEDCYKSMPASDLKPELSVSKTYIKLKDLILEKKALQKETNRLKTLNCHLERRLNEQEKRLSTVSLELTKTWHLVGKMQRQHRQLHTHEQILRYQLQQKRRLLNELKEELEYCRRKWAAARAKNAESQIQCDDLRKEFASRKLQDANNSAESGYSDGPVSDEDDISNPKPRNHYELFHRSRKFERTRSHSPNSSLVERLMKRVQSAPQISAVVSELSDITNDMTTNQLLHSVAASIVVSESASDMAVVINPPQKEAIAIPFGDTKESIPVLGNPQCLPGNSGGDNRSQTSSGAIPKTTAKLSRNKRELKTKDNAESLEEMFYRISGQRKDAKDLHTPEYTDQKRYDRATRIERLEKQCKALITQVIETSSCREQLNEQLTRFKQNVEPMISVDLSFSEGRIPSNLTTKNDQYSSDQPNVLKQFEEESTKILNRSKEIKNFGKNSSSNLDDFCSGHTNSSENSSDEPDNGKFNMLTSKTSSKTMTSLNLTPSEKASMLRRAERMQRLEEESKLLMSKVSKNVERGVTMCHKLEHLHAKYGSTSVPLNFEEMSTSMEKNASSSTHEIRSEDDHNDSPDHHAPEPSTRLPRHDKNEQGNDTK